MHLLMTYRPLRDGEAEETTLERSHDSDVERGQTIDFPEPLGPTAVRSVDDGIADLGTVHGDHGTLKELLDQGWSIR
jgi:hypothetical protein